MKPVRKIAIRRIKRDLGKSLSLSVTVLVLMLMISFFVLFSYSVSSAEINYGYLPVKDFANELIGSISIAVTAVLILSLITVHSYVGIRKEDNRQLLASLASVGAAKRQRNGLIYCELLLLFAPSAFIGTCIGTVLAKLISSEFIGIFADKEVTADPLYYLLSLAVFASGMILFYACYMLPEGKRSVINSVRKQNEKASAERHGYRGSDTFKKMNCLKRLAKKSTDYYAASYRRIAFSFASAVIYPILGIMLFVGIGSIDLIMDANPYDGIDTTAAVRDIAGDVAVFFIIGFFVLTVIGIFQTASMIKTQNLRRSESDDIYRRVGITSAELKLMRGYEYSSVLLWAFIILVFAFVLLCTVFFAF